MLFYCFVSTPRWLDESERWASPGAHEVGLQINGSTAITVAPLMALTFSLSVSSCLSVCQSRYLSLSPILSPSVPWQCLVLVNSRQHWCCLFAVVCQTDLPFHCCCCCCCCLAGNLQCTSHSESTLASLAKQVWERCQRGEEQEDWGNSGLQQQQQHLWVG